MADEVSATGAVVGDVVLNKTTGSYHRVVEVETIADVNGELVLKVDPPLRYTPWIADRLVASQCVIVDLDVDFSDPEEVEAWLQS